MDEDQAAASERGGENLESDPAYLKGASSDRTTPSRSPRVPRPWEALERLDRQWVDLTPLEDLPGPIAALAMTTPEDPAGWDYLTAMTGALPEEVAAACGAWLEAQLAADATVLGRSHRPTVELVPAGRLWYVVRAVGLFIVVVDGPGFLTPLSAAIAASRRYEAELRRSLETGPRDLESAAGEVEHTAGIDTAESDAPGKRDDPAPPDGRGKSK